MAICYLQYGPLLFKQLYRDDKESQDHVSNKLSECFLISNLSTLAFALTLGYILDRTKSWPLLALFHAITVIDMALFIYLIPTGERVYTAADPQPIELTITFVSMGVLMGVVVLINVTMVYKSLIKCTLTKGIFMGVIAFCGSTGVLIADGVGGHIYEANKRNPFLMSLCIEIFVSSVLFILACFR